MKASHSGRQCHDENLFKSLTQQKYALMASIYKTFCEYPNLVFVRGLAQKLDLQGSYISLKVLPCSYLCCCLQNAGKTDARMAAVTPELVACCGTCSVTARLKSSVVWLILPKDTNLPTQLCKTIDSPQKQLFCVPWLNFHQQPISLPPVFHK